MSARLIMAIIFIDVIFGIGAYMNEETGIAIVCSIGAIIGLVMFLILEVIRE